MGLCVSLGLRINHFYQGSVLCRLRREPGEPGIPFAILWGYGILRGYFVPTLNPLGTPEPKRLRTLPDVFSYGSGISACESCASAKMVPGIIKV